MAVYEILDVLYTSPEIWVVVMLVLLIQRKARSVSSLFESILNGFKQCILMLIQHVNPEKKDPTREHLKSNLEIYEDLKNDPDCGLFFRLENYEKLQIHDLLVIGEGSEAEVFKATGNDASPLAVKVYTGYRLRDLQRQWPRRLLKVAFQHVVQLKMNNPNYYLCLPIEATVLEDGRFAFIYPRYRGDLRTLIDSQMEELGCKKGPFSPSYTFSILHKIAKGMEMLHYMGFPHKDLKAKNVLYPRELKNCDDSSISGLHIGDMESSVTSKGTRMWRAPEIKIRPQPGSLSQASKWSRARKILAVVLLFTKYHNRNPADVYSFAMTCYEVLTGHSPAFPDCEQCNSPAQRAKAVRDFDDVYPGIGELLSRCWHEDPLQRPSFGAIVQDLESIRPKVKEQKKKRNGRGKGLRVDSLKEQVNTHNKRRTSSDLLSPLSTIVKKKQKRESSISREKSMDERRIETRSVHSFNLSGNSIH